MGRSAEVERWFKTNAPPAEAAMRRVRDIVLAADPSMSERVQYGSVTFSSGKAGDFASFVQYNKPGVNLMLMRGGRLVGTYAHLEGPTVKRMRIADEKEANARRTELTAIVKEWCALGETARAKTAPKGSRADRPARSRRAPRSAGAGRS